MRRIKLLNRFLSLLLLVISLASVSLVQTQAASMFVTPSNGSVLKVGQGCTQSVGVDVDTTGESSNAADATITYDPSKITVNSVSGGGAYEVFVLYGIDSTAGNIKFYAYTTNKNNVLTSRKRMANISITPKTGVTSASFGINFTGVGNTFDSNVADTTTSRDLLSSVTNSTVSFAPGICVAESPKISYTKPAPGSRNNLIDTQVVVQVTNGLADIDLDTVKFKIDNKDYTAKNDPKVTYTGSGKNYTFTIQPREVFAYDYDVNVYTEAKNTYGTLGSGSMTFGTKYVCSTDPNTPDTNTNSSSSSTVTNNNTNPSTNNNTTNQSNNTTTTTNSPNNNPSTQNSNYNNNSTIQNTQPSNPNPKIIESKIIESPLYTVAQMTTQKNFSTGQTVDLLWPLSWITFFLFILFFLEFFRRTIHGVAMSKLYNSSKKYWVRAVDVNTEKVVAQKPVLLNGTYDLHLNPGVYEIFLIEDPRAKISESQTYIKKVSIPKYQRVEVYSDVAKEFIPIGVSNNVDSLSSNESRYASGSSKLGVFFSKIFLWLIFSFRELVPGVIFAGIFFAGIGFYILPNLANLILLIAFVGIFIFRLLIPDTRGLVSYFRKEFLAK